MEKVTFAGGSCRALETAFRRVEGVIATRVGLMACRAPGHAAPVWQTRPVGRAPAVEVEFEPERVSFNTLLAVFWDSHDPSAPEGEEPGSSMPCRSVIFYHNDDQRLDAIASKLDVERSGRYRTEIQTEIRPAARFVLMRPDAPPRPDGRPPSRFDYSDRTPTDPGRATGQSSTPH